MAPYPSNRKTRSDYRRAVEVLSRHFTVAEELDRSKCGNFLMHIGERESGLGGAESFFMSTTSMLSLKK